MYLLCGLRGVGLRQCLPELWWRFRAQTHQALEELERRQLSWPGPGEHNNKKQAGRSRGS